MDPVLSLGPAPLANSFLTSVAEFSREPSYPLDLVLCTACGLAQIPDVIKPEVLFRHYLYLSGTSTTMAAHNAGYAQEVVELLHLAPNDLVVEIASNDGSLLSHFRQYGVRTLGIEPARNIATLARHRGIQTVAEFFEPSLATQIRATEGPARAILGNNVLAHVDDPTTFLRGAVDLLAVDGMVIVEVPLLRPLVEETRYDTIYHEHLSYFSVTALMALCEQVGLRVCRLEHQAVHGGSIRLFAGHVEQYPAHVIEAVQEAAAEQEAGMTSLERLSAFADDVASHRSALREMLSSLRDQGASVAAYGAPAKGNTLLNYCDIGPALVSYTVDRSPLKVGTYTPGMHLQVREVTALEQEPPDYVLILAWNFAEEIMAQLSEYHHQGGKFILPLPTPTIL